MSNLNDSKRSKIKYTPVKKQIDQIKFQVNGYCQSSSLPFSIKVDQAAHNNNVVC